ncbi:MAG: efflux RND transporter periplasmic adaptor subunit [Gammaproteobacteria bacterium]|nr:efflux RND transporter periplasmic adaptor subunit [Gammaproteobacteria bacterium]
MKLTRAAMLALLTFALVGCDINISGGDDSEDDEESAPIPVEIAAVRRGDINAIYTGTAALEVEAQADVLSKVAGEVTQLLVEEGDSVDKGQVLARLDGDRLRLEVQRQVANVRRLEQDYQRNLELHEKGLVSAGAFEGMKYELEAMRAALRLAQLELSYTDIRAPFAGVVSERHIRQGSTLTQNQRLFTVTDLDPLIAYLHIPEREFDRIRPGQPAAVEADALPGQYYEASVARISPVVDPMTGTFKATVEVADDSGRLKPGMFARVGIVFDRHTNALLVPRAALVDSDTDPALFVVTDGVAERRSVEVGYADGADIEITTGLDGSESIIVVGQHSLKDGGAVAVVQPDAPDTRTVVEQPAAPDNIS